MELWELEARESIRDLVARYNATGDSGRFDRVLALFADDAVMVLDGATGPVEYVGHDQIITIFTGTRDRWADEPAVAGSGTDASRHVRHHVSTLQIDVESETSASGYCYYQVVMAHGLDHWGRYFDRYERRNDRWLFVRRKVTREGSTTQA